MSQLELLNYSFESVKELIRNGEADFAKQVAIVQLKNNPLHPQWWLYLAESLDLLGMKAAAWKAYDRAWLLDPSATWVDEVKLGLVYDANEETPDFLTELLKAPHVTISAAMIVKNEERSIGETIRALQPAVDEIIVVDTGSEDQTVQIAEELGAKVFHFEWCDDFSAARNFGLDQVTSDWVLWVDADEILFPEDVTAPRIIAGLYNLLNEPVVVRPTIINRVRDRDEPNYDVPRLFPTRFGIRWWRRIHEQIARPTDDGGLTNVTYLPQSRIRFLHDGYQPDVIQAKNKMQRNINLLLKLVEDDANDIGAWAYLGRELCFNGQYADAIVILSHTEKLAQDHPTFGRLPEVRQNMFLALRNLNRNDEAIEVLERSVRDNENYPDAWYGLGIAKLAKVEALLKEASEAFLNAHNRAAQYRGSVSYDSRIPKWRAALGLADVFHMQGDWLKSLELYELVLQETTEKVPSQANIDKIKAQIKQLAEQYQVMD